MDDTSEYTRIVLSLLLIGVIVMAMPPDLFIHEHVEHPQAYENTEFATKCSEARDAGWNPTFLTKNKEDGMRICITLMYQADIAKEDKPYGHTITEIYPCTHGGTSQMCLLTDQGGMLIGWDDVRYYQVHPSETPKVQEHLVLHGKN